MQHDIVVQRNKQCTSITPARERGVHDCDNDIGLTMMRGGPQATAG
jgi:hypothetical protein